MEISNGVASVRGVEYSSVASYLTHWVEATPDDVFAGFVAWIRDLPHSDLEAVRAGLGDEEPYELMTFARRRALAALRSREPSLALEALHALSAIPPAAIADHRDLTSAAMLVVYAGQQLDPAFDSMAELIVDRTEPWLARFLRHLLGESIDLPTSCGYREVDSPTGRVLLHDDLKPYNPSVDLPRAAWQVVALLEADFYRMIDIEVGCRMNDAWIGGRHSRVAGALARLAGGLVINAADPQGPSQNRLQVFLGEATDERSAAAIAAAANGVLNPLVPQLAIAAGQVIVVMNGGSLFADKAPQENVELLTRFQDGLHDIVMGCAESR